MTSLNEIAAPAVVEALFATISYRLEPRGRGTRFPLVMNRLYSGGLKQEELLGAVAELDSIAGELRQLPLSKAIASMETLAPFRAGDAAAGSLSDYFLARNGVPLMAALRAAVEQSRASATPVEFLSPEVVRERRQLILAAIVGVTFVGYQFVPMPALIVGGGALCFFGGWLLFLPRPKRPTQVLDADIRIPVELSPAQLAHGVTLNITPPGASAPINVRIPEGLTDGQRIRLAGEGRPISGGRRGDLYLLIRCRP